jgi:hypothetical protein
MAEVQKSFDGYLEKLALISEAIDELYNGKKIIVLQLNREEFVRMRDVIKGIDESKNEFKIDISGIEFVFILDE